jgi:hypothetical protein
MDKAVKNLLDASVDEKLQLSVEQQDIVREPYVGSVILPAVHVAEHAFAM